MTFEPECADRDSGSTRELRRTAQTPDLRPLPAGTASGVSNAAPLTTLPSDLGRELEDAENLLRHAAAAGVDIDEEVRRAVVAAGATAPDRWTERLSLDLLNALTKLSAKLKPVSGDSLRKCAVNAEAARTILRLRTASIALFLVIVPFSVAAFVAAATCEAIHDDIELANALTVTLAREPSPLPVNPPNVEQNTVGDVRRHSEDEVKALQRFAILIRAIDRRAGQLVHFGFYEVSDPLAALRTDSEAIKQRFQLPARGFNVQNEVASKIALYQDVRSFAQSVQEMVQTSFGAVTVCVLPMLYALLGACAFLIRSFEEQRRTRTFISGRSNARLLIAGISGLVVGLFGNWGEGHKVGLSPLAIAFMVGYAVDVFFFFIDGLLQTFAGRRTEQNAGASRGSEDPAHVS
jgi:hypothetical protein